MKAFIIVINCALFFHGVFPLEGDMDEIQREEERLPHYLKDDGIKRVAKLDNDNFSKTLKASRMLVVMFYFSNKEDQEADRSWKTDEKLLEVGCYSIEGFINMQARVTSIQFSEASLQTSPQILEILVSVYLSHETNPLYSHVYLGLASIKRLCIILNPC